MKKLLHRFLICPYINVEDLRDTLFSLRNTGIFFHLSEICSKIIMQKVASLNDNKKRMLEELFKKLDNEHRLQICRENVSIESWENEVKKYEHIYDEIIDKFKSDYLDMSVEGIICDNTFENVKKILEPPMTFASYVKVYDPYFNIFERRHFKFLRLIIDLLMNNCVNKEKLIEIHTSGKNEEIRNGKLKGWKEKITELMQGCSNCEIIVCLWNDKKKWHDRYIDTDTAIFHTGRGVDIYENQEKQSTWGIVNNEGRKFFQYFEKNNPNGFILLKSITLKF